MTNSDVNRLKIESIKESYDKRLPINFVDLDYLVVNFSKNSFYELIESYNDRTPLTLIQLSELYRILG